MKDFDGLRVLVVEDEELVAMMIDGYLEDLGCTVAATARTVPEAVNAAETLSIQLALLDVNLAGKPVFPAAEALAAKGVPFIFSSGYGSSAVPEQFRAAPVIPKPFRIEEL